jgi:hypothetical protein
MAPRGLYLFQMLQLKRLTKSYIAQNRLRHVSTRVDAAAAASRQEAGGGGVGNRAFNVAAGG